MHTDFKYDAVRQQGKKMYIYCWGYDVTWKVKPTLRVTYDTATKVKLLLILII